MNCPPTFSLTPTPEVGRRITDADALREFTLKQVELALTDLRRKALLVA